MNIRIGPLCLLPGRPSSVYAALLRALRIPGGRSKAGMVRDRDYTDVVTSDISDEETVRQVVDRLQEKFPHVPRPELEHVAQSEFQLLAGRPVRDYLSILTERAAKKRLKKGSAAGT